MTRILVVVAFLAVASAISQPAEKDPNAPSYTQIIPQNDFEQIASDLKGPIGVLAMRSKVRQVQWGGRIGVIFGFLFLIAGIALLCAEPSEPGGAIVMLVISVILFSWCVFLLSGASYSALNYVLENPNIQNLRVRP